MEGQKLIFDWNCCCAVAEVRELSGDTPVTLPGPGLWAGILSSGRCRAEGPGGHDAAGASGDLLLCGGTVTLLPLEECHLLAVRLTGFAAEEFCTNLGHPRFADGTLCPGAAELLARLCDAHPTDTAEQSQRAYALLCELSHADEAVRRLSPLVAEAVTAIRDNYMGLYGVEELSRQLGVSKCHLVRTFSAEMGVSPGKYLTTTRIEAAKLLLLEREYSLDMIAALCGFSSANYLCRVFKRETGQTPAAWRDSNAPAPAVRLPSRSNEIYL